MNMFSSQMKKRSADAAYGSVRAEGLTPSVKTQERIKQYVEGKITKAELRHMVISDVRQDTHQK